MAVAYEHIVREIGSSTPSTDIDKLKHETFFGREKENLVFPIALANLTAAWNEDEENEGQPFPSHARLLPLRGTPEAESRYS